MTRKLGRLLVVALVVAAVVTPVTVASADVAPVLTCHGIQYDETNPYHIVYPTSLDMNVKYFVDKWDLWENRHFGGTNDLSTLIAYRVFNMNDVADELGAPPEGEQYVFFWDDLLDPDPVYHMRIVGTPYDDIICGSPYDDVILGRGGNDIIRGGSANPIAGPTDSDIIIGGKGDDLLIGGHGWDGIAGNAGNDVIYGYFPPEEEVDPTEGPFPFVSARANGGPNLVNALFGGPGNDTIYTQDVYHKLGWSLDGDYANGGGGDDLLVGGDAIDELVGSLGNDTITGGDGDDILVGGAGADQIWGEEGADQIYGRGGNDILYASSPLTMNRLASNADWSQNDVIRGNAGDDTIYAGLGALGEYYGGAGGDSLHGNIQKDFLYGGPGNDWIKGSGGADYIMGGPGDDTIFGGYAIAIGGVPDATYPDLGDEIYGGSGGDSIYGEEGDDYIYGGTGSDWINAGAGDDYVWGDLICTNAEPCTKDDGHGDDVIYGEEGDDYLNGGYGADLMYGGDGNDIMSGIDYAMTDQSDDAVDRMFGGKGNDVYFGACDDLDEAYENSLEGMDTAVLVPLLFGGFAEPGDVVIACT